MIISSCGSNQFGQLGIADPAPDADRYLPTPLRSFSVETQEIPKLHALFAGDKTSFALVHSRSFVHVFAWGSNDAGQLGLSADESLSVHSSPVEVKSLRTTHVSPLAVTLIAPGWLHTLVLTRSGSVYALGSNKYFQCAPNLRPDILREPTIILSLPPIHHLAAGVRHSLFVTRDGRLLATGAPRYVNQPSAPDPPATAKAGASKWVEVTMDTGAKYVACGMRFSAVIDSDDNLWTFGRNDWGQCGVVGEMTRTMTKLESLPKISDVRCGWSHCVVRCKDEVYSWGRNDYGQCGRRPRCRSLVVGKVDLPNPAISISCGSEHSGVLLAICSNERDDNAFVSLFGWNEHGQLGCGHSREMEVIKDVQQHTADSEKYSTMVLLRGTCLGSAEKRAAVEGLQGGTCWLACGGSHTLLPGKF